MDSWYLKYLKLPANTTTRDYCPFCNAEHEKSFIVTRKEDQLLFICFRAKCGVYGAKNINTGDVHWDISSTEEQRHGKHSLYKQIFENADWVPDEIMDAIHEQYGFYPHGIYYHNGRLLLPCYDTYCNVMGCVNYRDPRNKAAPKAYTWCFYKDMPHPLYSFCGSTISASDIVLVEDWFSAAKVWHEFGHHPSRTINSLALLGSSLPHKLKPHLISEFMRMNIENVYVWLDNDALDKATKIADELAPYFNVRVIHSPKDPKYYFKNKMEEFLGIKNS